jgi:hypothetical protein
LRDPLEYAVEGVDQIEHAHLPKRPLRHRLDGLWQARVEILLRDLALAEMSGGVLEFLIFDELTHQLPAGIFLLRLFFRWLHAHREQAAALDVDEVRRHDHETRPRLEIERLERVHELQVLLRDPLDRDVVDIHLILLDEVEEQIERSLEDLELDLVFAGHGPARLRAAAPFCLARRDRLSARPPLPSGGAGAVSPLCPSVASRWRREFSGRERRISAQASPLRTLPVCLGIVSSVQSFRSHHTGAGERLLERCARPASPRDFAGNHNVLERAEHPEILQDGEAAIEVRDVAEREAPVQRIEDLAHSGKSSQTPGSANRA